MEKEHPRPYGFVIRQSTGINGLDKYIEGGFIENDTYLVTGTTGAGKTIFCCQFLWEGLEKAENCIYFSLEELPDDVMNDASNFGWDFKKYIDSKQFLIQYYDPFEMINISSEIKKMIDKFHAKRVVIDSTSIFGMFFEKQHELRKKLYELITALKGTNAVVLMTSEIPEDSKMLSRYGVEEFVVDGVIVLNYMGIGGEFDRSMLVRKMRRTNHYKDIIPFSITSNGIVIKKED